MPPIQLQDRPAALLAPEPIEDATRREFITGIGAVALAAAFLAACGDGNDDLDDGSGTITIDDYFGPVTIPVDPQRVVAGDFTTLGNMLALGVTPSAAPFSRGNPPDYLTGRLEGIEDVNTESGLDLEKILTLDPDLMITSVGLTGLDPWGEEDYRRYQAAVPTFGYTHHYMYIEQLVANLTEVARALGREDRAQEVVAEYEARVAGLRERVIAAGLAERPVSIARIVSDRYWLLFGISGNIAFRALGIPQPAGLDDPEEFGREVSLEQLNLLNEADTVFLFVDAGAEAQFASTLDSPVWQGLEPVRNGRVHQVSSGSWNSIDFIGLMQILDDIEAVYIAPAEAEGTSS